MSEIDAERLRSALSLHAISEAVQRIGDGSQEFKDAANEGHHLSIGPGEPCISEWKAAGLELPDLPAMRQWRLDRLVEKLREFDYGGILLFDPLNVRYATDTTNMQLWVMHNGARYAYVSADGYVIVWDYTNTEFLDGHSHVVDEVRPAVGVSYFLCGSRYQEIATRWADEIASVIRQHQRGNSRLAVDVLHGPGHQLLAALGIEVGFGYEVMEEARRIKGNEELKAMRCAIHACEMSMKEMEDGIRPGMTERDVWSMLHAGNIRRAGEWIETQLLTSGPRTNPWMQEASSRFIEKGDLLAYDTDLVGAYGMMCDISRTLVVGDTHPTPNQSNLHAIATDVIESNFALLTPGRSFRDLTHQATLPDPNSYRHYSCLFHSVGQCDEFPNIVMPAQWADFGCDGILEAGMVLTVESFVGRRDGGEGVKLEIQALVTEDGPERLDFSSLELSD
jgi:Xaa-Pro aminopeptidase